MLGRFIWFFAIVIMVSCQDKTISVVSSKQNSKDQLLDLNRKFAKAEAKFIATMIDSLAIPAIEDSLGYWYLIYSKGSQQPIYAHYKDRVKVRYSLCLLEGDTIYGSSNMVEKSFVVGRTEIESGLHHAVKHLSVGDKAKIILPSHLAFGTYGDGAKVPAKASLLYDLELIKIYSK
ncbi:MAG: FKBP-type peptidyl-prolyl cis-trans isomerase FkpA [Flavobacteriales bacterium]|jgi:FKBP-type peptidyl-prolyl cis-trans isomerase FkpA